MWWPNPRKVWYYGLPEPPIEGQEAQDTKFLLMLRAKTLVYPPLSGPEAYDPNTIFFFVVAGPNFGLPPM